MGLRDNGLVESKSQGKGSHRFWKHPLDASRETTVPDYDVIDPGLAHDIIIQSGKTLKEYMSHL